VVTTEQRMIDVDGATLEVLLSGDALPAICNTHPSGGMTAEEWGAEPHIGTWRDIWVNARGLGTSSPVRLQRELTFSQLVDDLEAVRTRLGLDRWVYWGGSSGGCIGLLYALRYPQSLAGLIVEMSTPSGDGFITDPAFDHPVKPYFERVQDGSWINLAYRTDPEMTIHFRANVDELGVFDVRDRLGEIAVPTLVVAGHHDVVHPPAHARQIHAGIPGSEWLLLKHSGHGDIAEEDLPLYRATVARFLAGIAASTLAVPQSGDSAAARGVNR
jgi:proline iminopeptidase